jgi:hypothetical protein
MRQMRVAGRWSHHLVGMGVLLTFLSICACGTSSQQSLSTPIVTATPTTTNQQATIGQVVSVNAQWQVQITSFAVSAQGDTPSVEQVALGLTLTNQSAQAGRLDDKYQWTLRDMQGQRHALGRDAALCQLSTGQPDCLDHVLLAPHTSATGTLGAIVITGRRDYVLTLTSQESVTPAAQVTWNLSLAAS